MLKIATGLTLLVALGCGLVRLSAPGGAATAALPAEEVPPSVESRLEPGERLAAPSISSRSLEDRTRQAVERGLAFLKRSQRPDGGWHQDVGYKRGSSYIVTKDMSLHVGVSALSLMAFLSGGHLPGRGEHAATVERGIDCVLAAVDQNLGFITTSGTRMYSHAFATLFLAEIYGMTHRSDMKAQLQLAVDMIVKSQNKLGSWRYQPFSETADMSITVCQMMALRAARNVGIRVPKKSIDRAFDYVDRSAVKTPGHYHGSFRYKVQERGNRTSFPLTAAGIATLNHAGIYESELVTSGINYLQRAMDPLNERSRFHYFYWYGHYYAAQVFFFAGDTHPDLWKWYWDQMREDLLNGQNKDGSWPCTTGPGKVFSTAVACIILQIPNQYLPIFHR